mgnify:CR=1 FL=1
MSVAIHEIQSYDQYGCIVTLENVDDVNPTLLLLANALDPNPQGFDYGLWVVDGITQLDNDICLETGAGFTVVSLTVIPHCPNRIKIDHIVTSTATALESFQSWKTIKATIKQALNLRLIDSIATILLNDLGLVDTVLEGWTSELAERMEDDGEPSLSPDNLRREVVDAWRGNAIESYYDDMESLQEVMNTTKQAIKEQQS